MVIVNGDDWYEPNVIQCVADNYDKQKYNFLYGMCAFFETKEVLLINQEIVILLRPVIEISHEKRYIKALKRANIKYLEIMIIVGVK